jgi:glutamate dehydrogenase (NAD(P)+)
LQYHAGIRKDKKSYTFRKADGLDIEQMASIKDSFGTIDKKKAQELGCEILDGWRMDFPGCMIILLPCALENQLTPATFAKISKRVKIICEGSNGPTNTDCDELIKASNIFLVPDFSVMPEE